MPAKCLICKENNVYEVKSHLTPAAITRNTFGPRNKEEIFTIDPTKATIERYYGSEHSQQNDTEIKMQPNARKGIFCKECENNLAKYESAVQPRLNEIVNSLGKGIHVLKSPDWIKYVEIGIHPNLLVTYFQSIVWRQCLEQTLDHMDNPLPENEFESLRVTLLENIRTPLNEMQGKNLTKHRDMSAISTYDTDLKSTPSYSNPHTANTNPRIFFIGPIALLYWLVGNTTQNFSEITDVDSDILKNDYRLHTARLVVINNRPWTKIHFNLASTVAKQYNRTRNH